MAKYRKAYPPGSGRYDPTYYLANKARENARSESYRTADLSRAAARVKAWRDANPERWKAIQERMRGSRR